MKRWFWIENKAVKGVRFLVSADTSSRAMERVSFPDQECTFQVAGMDSINDILGTHSRDGRSSGGFASGDLIFDTDHGTVVLKQPY